MKFVRLFLSVTSMTCLCAPLVLAQERTDKLGSVHFPVSCSAEAQRQFDRGVALLHSFWFSESIKAFTAVTESDPGCAMGYWGIAMTLLGNPLAAAPRPRAIKRALVAIEKAKTVGTKTDRERDYIVAIETMYKDPGVSDPRSRALAYEKAMEQMYRRYPDDQEAAVFYALALNITIDPTDKTYANQLKAGAILEKVFARQPDHPGVAHYIIHTYDYPPLASRGLAAARLYAKIAPSTYHAHHMPSHIFTQLGMWQDSIKSNIAALAISKAVGFDESHQMHFLVYAYLQGAEDLEAKRVLDELNALQKVPESVGRHVTFAAIPVRFAIERRAWSEAKALEPRPGLHPAAAAFTYFARAVGSARSGDAASARQAIDKLRPFRDALVNENQRYWADQVEIQQLAATAWLARQEGRNQEALRLMRAAADLEDSMEKHVSTPAPFVLAREQLAEMLFESKESGQALKEFEASLGREPNRFHGLYGAAQAAELAGNSKQARTYYAKLVAVCAQADTARPELQKAKAFLAQK